MRGVSRRAIQSQFELKMMNNLEKLSGCSARFAVFFVLLVYICATSTAKPSFLFDSSQGGVLVNKILDLKRDIIGYFDDVVRHSIQQFTNGIDGLDTLSAAMGGRQCPCSCEYGEAPYEIPLPTYVSHRRWRRGRPNDPRNEPTLSRSNPGNRMAAKRVCIEHEGTCRVQIRMEDK